MHLYVYFRSKSLIKDTIKALNILYTYDQTYEPYLILWLFPLQVSFLIIDIGIWYQEIVDCKGMETRQIFSRMFAMTKKLTSCLPSLNGTTDSVRSIAVLTVHAKTSQLYTFQRSMQANRNINLW